MEDVVHKNLTDPNEQVYCHLNSSIVSFDGPFVAQTCWMCPFFVGLAGGFGVECCYDDANATTNPMIFNKPSAAQAEAPDAGDDPTAIASQAGIASAAARVQAMPQESDVPAQDEDVADGGADDATEGDANAPTPPGNEAKAPAGKKAPTPPMPSDAKVPAAPGAKAPAVPNAKAPPVPSGIPAPQGNFPPKKKSPFPPKAKSLAPEITETIKALYKKE